MVGVEEGYKGGAGCAASAQRRMYNKRSACEKSRGGGLYAHARIVSAEREGGGGCPGVHWGATPAGPEGTSGGAAAWCAGRRREKIRGGDREWVRVHMGLGGWVGSYRRSTGGSGSEDGGSKEGARRRGGRQREGGVAGLQKN